jgi:hypothetical protein
MKRSFPFEFAYQVFSLFIALIVVHTVYVTVVRPRAAEVVELQQRRLEQDATYVPGRSIYVVIQDLEQEACFVLMFWALAIMGYKGWAAWRERKAHASCPRTPANTRAGYRACPPPCRGCCCPAVCSARSTGSQRPAT